MSENKVVKAGLGYTIGNILLKGINFLSVPLFSRIMTTEEFGVYNVFASYDAIIYMFVGLALHSSVKNADIKFEDKTDDYVSSISLIYLINTALFFIIVAVFERQLTDWLDFPSIVLFAMILYSFGTSIITLYNNRISLQYAYKKYLIIAGINSIGNISFSLILMLTVFRNRHELGRILGSTAIIFSLAIIVLFSMYRKARPRFNLEYWKYGIKYSLPIIPHGLSQVILSQVDRIMICSIVSGSAAGIYSLAGNVQLILTIISDSIITVWVTWFYERMKDSDEKSIQKRSISLVILFMIMVIGVLAIAPEAIFILGGTKYDSAKYVVIPMILSAFMIFLYNVIVPSEYYTEKTLYIMGGTIIAAVINLIGNYVFITQYGYIAAAYTTLFSYVCYVLLHAIISYKLVKFHVIPLSKLLLIVLIVVACAVIDIVFINHILIRYLMGGLVICSALLVLVKDNNIDIRSNIKDRLYK